MFTDRILRNLIWVGLGVLSFHSSAYALSDEQITDIISDKMHERHPNDRASEWTTLGPQTPHLILKYMQETRSDIEKLRLLGVLGNFSGNSEVADYLRGRAQSADSPMEKSVALRSLAEAQGAASIEFITPFLKDAASEVRIAAADTLRRVGGKDELALVSAQAREESAPGVGARMLSSSAQPLTPVQLRPVSKLDGQGSEDLAKEWSGKWSGFTVVQEFASDSKDATKEAARETTVKALPVILNLGFQTGSGWSVEMTANGKKLETSSIHELPAHTGLGVSVSGWVKGTSESVEIRFHRDPDRPQLKAVQLEGARSGSVALLKQ